LMTNRRHKRCASSGGRTCRETRELPIPRTNCKHAAGVSREPIAKIEPKFAFCLGAHTPSSQARAERFDAWRYSQPVRGVGHDTCAFARAL